ncbi:pseudouridine-metabolizing bifunctional protein [Arthroderma uncinatum]|uniref:pseudouridine-metabolizing bifunctional protein n=1 Tax=Arthroderma uncinatum TaxID=74035 RepID=UPI00144A6B27|nr:pseudouridine-metabolizing bifunctional protein [Arthroderma uncinatum]KAF3480326.1 pseudouridine-metabolizing bifunctional protein [Arthroderma uncinatum]
MSPIVLRARAPLVGRLPSRGLLRSPAYRALYHSRPSLRPSNRFLKVSEEVEDAIATGKPVVALETTIYTHGFPYPNNVDLAMRLESIVRSTGGVPATIGVLDGVARVGMNENELTELASTSQRTKVHKVSRRDLGYICGAGIRGNVMNGGTTIAGTMILAHLAGIKVFATGGLGGVHRGGETTMDISADLTELGRTPVAVVSSGCKSFLDIQRTLEYLETEGVVVAAFADGRKGEVEFPAFFTRDSGIKAPRVIQNEQDAAAIIYAQSQLQLSSGMLFTNPVPEEHSFPKPEMDAIIARAVELAHIEGVQGSDNTPYVLAKIEELSGGRSVATNKALVEYNVEVGTKVAIELAKLELEGNEGANRSLAVNIPINQARTEEAQSSPEAPAHTAGLSTTQGPSEGSDVLVAGSLAVDLACDYAPLSNRDSDGSPKLQTSNPSIITQTLGGVGHNVALAASYMGSSVMFCSVVADDISGRSALGTIQDTYNSSFQPEGIQLLPSSHEARTAQYIAVNDVKKDLMIAMADMSILELPEGKLNFDTFWEPLVQNQAVLPSWAVVDANWGSGGTSEWIQLCKRQGMKIALEPVSAPKASRLFYRQNDTSGHPPVIRATDMAPDSHVIDLATPNRYELAAMHAAARDTGHFDSPEWWRIIDALQLPSSGSRVRLVSLTNAEIVNEGVPQQSIQLLPLIPCILTKLGSQGVLLTQILWPGDARLSLPEYAPYILGRSLADDSPVGGVYMRLFPPEETFSDADVVSVNGAGDTLLGVVVAALGRGGRGREVRVEDVIPIAQRASAMTMRSKHAVSPEISQLAPLLASL